MAIAVRMARATRGGPLASGAGTVRMGSGGLVAATVAGVAQARRMTGFGRTRCAILAALS